MNVSTKGRYALEVALDLAMNSSEERLESIKNIASRRNLSEKYLERIVGMLKKAGIVSSTRGAKGGYCLSRNPDEIKVSEILMAAEGNLAPVECLSKEVKCGMECDKCATRIVWDDIWSEIKAVIENTTLEELLEESGKYNGIN